MLINDFYGYVYRTTNIINGKVYIGQSTRNSDKDINQYLGSGFKFLNAINKYGNLNFSKDILEYAYSHSQLNQIEIYYISLFQSNKSDFGYNIQPGGSPPSVINITSLQKMSDCKRFDVLVFDLKGNLQFNLKSTHEGVKYGFIQKCIASCARGESKQHKGFIFIYKKDFSENLLLKRLKDNVNKKFDGVTGTQVIQKDIENNIVHIFKSKAEFRNLHNIKSKSVLERIINKNILYKNHYYEFN